MPTPLDILYPNGQVEAVQVYIWDGSKPVLWDGSVTGAVGGSSGTAIQDGVSSSTKATVAASPYDSSKNSLIVSDGITTRSSKHLDGSLAYTAQSIAAAPWNLEDGHIGSSGFGGVIDYTASGTYSSGVAHMTSTVTNPWTTVLGAYKLSGAVATSSGYQSPFGWR